jgi:hypothetical protein
MQINISAAIAYDPAFEWFVKYTRQDVSHTVAFSKIEVELYVAKLPYDDEEWSDLVDIFLKEGEAGMERIMGARNLIKAGSIGTSTSSKYIARHLCHC